jgi:hypothetical protein
MDEAPKRHADDCAIAVGRRLSPLSDVLVSATSIAR